MKKSQACKKIEVVGQPPVTKQHSEQGEVLHVCRLASASWPDIAAHVEKRCRYFLRHRRNVDPGDAAQDVLVILLRRDFGSKFDAERTKFLRYLDGVIERVCNRMVAVKARENARFKPLMEEHI